MAAVLRFDRFRTAFFLLALAFLPLWLTGCAVNLGPTFRLRRERVVVHYAVQPIARLQTSVHVVVRNVGTRSLAELRFRTAGQLEQVKPAAAASAQSGSDASEPDDRASASSIAMKPSLGRRRSRMIFFSRQIPLEGLSVFLEPDEWFPSFIPPRGLFGRGEPWAPRTEIDIFVPYGYRALTSGRLRRARQGHPGGEAEYAYSVRQEDFPPYLVVGQYEQQKIRVRGQSVLFWSSTPFDPGCARTVADEAVETAGLYRSLFGRLPEYLGPIRVIEIASAGTGSREPDETAPNAVLFSVNPADACRQMNRFLFLVARNLAATWFGWGVRPEPAARAILGTGAQDYAALIAEEKREGPAARKRQVIDWLTEYDRLRSRAKPLPPGELGTHPTGDQLRMAGVQSALCLVALEDRLGADPVRRALKDVVGALEGSTAGRNELRSALERESGQDLYEFFNEWLGKAGVPAAFRRRYTD